ncbi:Uncharacterised protein [Vibrio cholerae]|nr:Uncharacterised protein [Vibrio cholerae]
MSKLHRREIRSVRHLPLNVGVLLEYLVHWFYSPARH